MRATWWSAVLASVCVVPAAAVEPADVHGLWLTAQADAVIAFGPCEDRVQALCAQVVWDKDAGTPKDTCGVKVARLERFASDAWRDGWALDPRDGKKYKATVRIQEGALLLRAFVGVEVLGQTERLSRIAKLPEQPVCQPVQRTGAAS